MLLLSDFRALGQHIVTACEEECSAAKRIQARSDLRSDALFFLEFTACTEMKKRCAIEEIRFLKVKPVPRGQGAEGLAAGGSADLTRFSSYKTGQEETTQDSSMTNLAAILFTLLVVFNFTFFVSVTSDDVWESMRLDPISWITARIARRDDIFPLAFPITTESGKQIASIPIKKGTQTDISTAVYNQ